jgi:hypothetical protein
MSRFSALAAELASDQQYDDRWLSLVPAMLPDLGDEQAERILSRARPSLITIPEDAPPSIF